jgi:hypothetical protein
MQLVVETLTSDYYGDSILVDYAMAHRVIAYCRRVADGRLVGGWPMGAAKITGRAARFTK